MQDIVILDCAGYGADALASRLEAGAALLGGWERYVKRGMKVLLKPNLIGPKSSDTAAVTHCEFVRAVGRALKALGCEVWIGDSAGGAIGGLAPTAQGMKVAGYEAVAREEGFLIKNFEREGSVAVSPPDAPERVYHLAKPLFEADAVINLPKLKTHSAATYTGACKNLFGCVPGLKKAEYHRLAPNTAAFGECIADIDFCVKPVLHVMDGVVAMQGAGPTAGKPYAAGKILMSADPLALDAAACAMIGLEASALPIFESAIRRKLGEWRLDAIRILGDHSSPPRLKGFSVPDAIRVGPRMAKVFGAMIRAFKRRPAINLKKCVDCRSCVAACPVKAIDAATKAIDYGICIECLCCHEMCMYKAVELKRINKFMAFIAP